MELIKNVLVTPPFLCLLISLLVCSANPLPRYPYKEKFFDQFIDHFNSESYGKQTFRQRYFVTGNITNLSPLI